MFNFKRTYKKRMENWHSTFKPFSFILLFVFLLSVVFGFFMLILSFLFCLCNIYLAINHTMNERNKNEGEIKQNTRGNWIMLNVYWILLFYQSFLNISIEKKGSELLNKLVSPHLFSYIFYKMNFALIKSI